MGFFDRRHALSFRQMAFAPDPLQGQQASEESQRAFSSDSHLKILACHILQTGSGSLDAWGSTLLFFPQNLKNPQSPHPPSA